MKDKRLHLIFQVNGNLSDESVSELSSLIMRKMLDTGVVDFSYGKESAVLCIRLDKGRTVREIQEESGVPKDRLCKDEIYEKSEGYYLYTEKDIYETLDIMLAEQLPKESPKKKQSPIKALDEYEANEVICTHQVYMKSEAQIGHRNELILHAGMEYSIVEYMMDVGHVGWKFFTKSGEYIYWKRKDYFATDAVHVLKTTYPK